MATTRDAKEFLIAQIVAEAEREGVQLSAIERKMLYFSETAWSLPDIYEVNDAFDATYDSAEYELKISDLIKNRTRDMRQDDPEKFGLWKQAVKLLEREDHYILVLIGIAEGRFSAGGTGAPPKWKRWGLVLLTVVVGTAVGLAAIAVYFRLHT